MTQTRQVSNPPFCGVGRDRGRQLKSLPGGRTSTSAPDPLQTLGSARPRAPRHASREGWHRLPAAAGPGQKCSNFLRNESLTENKQELFKKFLFPPECPVQYHIPDSLFFKNLVI